MQLETIEIPNGGKPGVKLPYAMIRVLISLIAGLISLLLIAFIGHPKYALLVGWDVIALTWILWTVLLLKDPDAQKTASIANREDPGRTAIDALLVLASLGSLIAVALLLAKADQQHGFAQFIQVSIGMISVILSWITVHLIFTIRYAILYYKNGGGISFNSRQAPNFLDFLYVTITIATSFQVSDTNISRREIRKAVSQHVLISYIYATVIIATAVNLILSLH